MKLFHFSNNPSLDTETNFQFPSIEKIFFCPVVIDLYNACGHSLTALVHWHGSVAAFNAFETNTTPKYWYERQRDFLIYRP